MRSLKFVVTGPKDEDDEDKRANGGSDGLESDNDHDGTPLDEEGHDWD